MVNGTKEDAVLGDGLKGVRDKLRIHVHSVQTSSFSQQLAWIFISTSSARDGYKQTATVAARRPISSPNGGLISFGAAHAKVELITCEKTTMEKNLSMDLLTAQRYPRWSRPVRHFVAWIGAKGVLSGARAAQSSAQLRRHWAASITRGTSPSKYRPGWREGREHPHPQRHAGVIDFGSSYTVGGG